MTNERKEVLLSETYASAGLSEVAEKVTGAKFSDGAALATKITGWGMIGFGAAKAALGVLATFKGGRGKLSEYLEGEIISRALATPRRTTSYGAAGMLVGSALVQTGNYANTMHNLRDLHFTLSKQAAPGAAPAPDTQVAKLAARDAAAEKSGGQSVG